VHRSYKYYTYIDTSFNFEICIHVLVKTTIKDRLQFISIVEYNIGEISNVDKRKLCVNNNQNIIFSSTVSSLNVNFCKPAVLTEE